MLTLTSLLAALTLPRVDNTQITRRHITAATGLALLPTPCAADEFIMSDEEAARVARKMELLRAKSGGAPAPRVPDAQTGMQLNQAVFEAGIRSDFNPEAAVALRSRTFAENAKATLAKQEELKKRDAKQKRDDLCEMLGRGC